MTFPNNLNFKLREIAANPVYVAFILVLFLKLLLTLFGPFFSTDYERNLFYGKAFWENGFFYVYNLTPLNIDPNYSLIDPSTGVLSYSYTTYDYPVVQLLFWSIVSLFPFIVGKVVLTFVDVINFLLIRDLLKDASRREKEIVSWSYFILVTIFSSIDGQPEVITLLFMLLVLKFMKNKPLLAFLLAGIGFLWKYIPLIMFFYLLVYFRKNQKIVLQGTATFIGTSVGLSLIPILTSAYIFRYVSYIGNLPYEQLPSNPMAWKFLYLSSILLWILIFYLIYYMLKNKDQIPDFVILFPLLLFLKYYQFAFPWYWLWLIPGVLVLKKDIRVTVWKALLIILPIVTIDFIHLTVGFDFVLNSLF